MFFGIRNCEIDNKNDWELLWKDYTLELSALSEETVAKLGTLYPNEFIIFKFGEAKCPTIHKKGVFKILKDKSHF